MVSLKPVTSPGSPRRRVRFSPGQGVEGAAGVEWKSRACRSRWERYSSWPSAGSWCSTRRRCARGWSACSARPAWKWLTTQDGLATAEKSVLDAADSQLDLARSDFGNVGGIDRIGAVGRPRRLRPEAALQMAAIATAIAVHPALIPMRQMLAESPPRHSPDFAPILSAMSDHDHDRPRPSSPRSRPFGIVGDRTARARARDRS